MWVSVSGIAMAFSVRENDIKSEESTKFLEGMILITKEELGLV